MPVDREKAARYRHRAEEVRSIAQGVIDKKSRETLLHVAADYLDMADAMDDVAGSQRAIDRNRLI